MKNFTFFLILSSIFYACQDHQEENDLVEILASPVKEGGEPNLFVSSTGGVYLSWIEYINDTTDELRFSRLEEGEWSRPQIIAQGTDWFVNWADFPSMVVYESSERNIATHWLQKRAEGAYDYDVRIAQSKDGGKNWTPSFIPHRDSIAAEHGFVTLLPLSGETIFATWLDGRNTKLDNENHDDHDHHDHGGAMTLRCANFDLEGSLSEEFELDNRICDCCQTDAVFGPDGPIVVYRDRSEEEIRDIYIVRKEGERWSKPKPVFDDNWKIAGCPVNGPAVAIMGQNLAIAWYTAANESPQVKVAFSKDAGENISEPIRLDNGQAIGRVDVIMLSEDRALVSWLEQAEEGATIKAAIVSSTGQIEEEYNLVKTNESRSSGFPILEKSGNDVYLAWTAVDSNSTTVQTAVLNL